jgi:hypothetical protein
VSARIRIHRLARELGVESLEIQAFLWRMGVDASSAMAAIEEPLAQRVRDEFASD